MSRIHIDPETERLAREVAALTGETMAQAIQKALTERLRQVRAQGERPRLADQLNEIALHCAALPDLDTRAPDDIIGYDDKGQWRSW